jgi:hypothetical protein
MVFSLSAAAAEPGISANIAERPHTNGEPTDITVQLFLLDVTRIQGASQSFTADLFMLLTWKDERIAGPGTGPLRLPVDSVWNPQIQIINQQRVDRTFPELVDVASDGTVTYRQRVYGEFSAPMELHKFPMDEHRIGFRFVVPRYTTDEVRIVPDDSAFGAVIAQELSIADWDISDFRVRTEPFAPVRGGPEIAGIVGDFNAKRRLGFYASKAFLSVAIIVFMSWVVFWVDPSYVAPRMSVAVTSMLTLIAYRFLLGGVLPPLSYLTRMDHFLLASTLIVLVALIQVAYTTQLHSTERADQAARVNAMSRWVFPLVFFVAAGMILALA